MTDAQFRTFQSEQRQLNYETREQNRREADRTRSEIDRARREAARPRTFAEAAYQNYQTVCGYIGAAIAMIFIICGVIIVVPAFWLTTKLVSWERGINITCLNLLQNMDKWYYVQYGVIQLFYSLTLCLLIMKVKDLVTTPRRRS